MGARQLQQTRYGKQASFEALNPIHQQVHALALELLALHAQGQQAQAVARLVDLYALRETLLEQLKVLLKQSASLGSA